jgi:tRNA nucleotidyltransferase/poly(A) polymerase
MMQAFPIRRPLTIDLPDDVLRLAEIFSAAGHSLFVVGGAVRDALLGKKPKDIDLATNAIPDRVIQILSLAHGFTTKEVGKAFGVVLVCGPCGEEFEIATFRRDIGSGRRPTGGVDFVTIDKDVARRDLTINALFYDISTGEVVDYVGGISDIETGTIRAVGDASERFKEDRLRILRTIRFAGRFGSKVQHETAHAIMSDNRLTNVGPDDDISPERIRDEFLKGITSAKSVVHYIDLVEQFDLWYELFPGLGINQDFEEVSDVAVQLALLLRDNSIKDVASVMFMMKYTSEEIAQVKFLLRFQDLSTCDGAVVLKKAFKSAHLTPKQLQTFAVYSETPSKNYANNFLEFLTLPPAASARQLMEQGITGIDLGQCLDEAEAELFSSLS